MLGADLSGANLADGTLSTLGRYKPPRPPKAPASRGWRTEAMAAVAGQALYTQLDNRGDDDDDDDKHNCDDAQQPNDPWKMATEGAMSRAVSCVVLVGQPLLGLVEGLSLLVEVHVNRCVGTHIYI